MIRREGNDGRIRYFRRSIPRMRRDRCDTPGEGEEGFSSGRGKKGLLIIFPTLFEIPVESDRARIGPRVERE